MRLRLAPDSTYHVGRLRALRATEVRLVPREVDTVEVYPLIAGSVLEVPAGGGALAVLESGGKGWLAGMALSGLYALLAQGTGAAGVSETTFLASAMGGAAVGLVWGGTRLNRWRPVALEAVDAVSTVDEPVADRAAAEADFASARSWVRVRTREGERHVGAVRSFDDGTLSIRRSDGRLAEMSLSSLTRVQVHRGRTHKPLSWMFRGLAGGAVLGAVIGLAADRFGAYGCAVGSCGERRWLRAVRRGAIEGTAVGAVFGLMHTSDDWEDVAVQAVPQVLVAPTTGGLSVGLVLGEGVRR